MSAVAGVSTESWLVQRDLSAPGLAVGWHLAVATGCVDCMSVLGPDAVPIKGSRIPAE